jgi:nucleoside-diphosphate-sugar epimerase
MNNILLAGANGNIGSFLYTQLKENFDLRSISYSKDVSKENFRQVNLADLGEIHQFVENTLKCDALIFLVGLAHKKGKGKEIEEFRNVNTQTLVNLLSELIKREKFPLKVIFASTISVYGEKREQSTYTEDSETKPFSPYAITKLEAEAYLLAHFPDQSWILRLAPVYSSEFQLNINRRTKMGGLYYKVGNGTAKLSLCSLENIGAAVEGILNDKVPAGIYNISDAKEYSFNDLLKWENVNWVIPIPGFLIKFWYYIGKVMNNIFLKENATKLISDNTFPSDKIRQYISLPATLDDCKVSFNQR